jgi:hypothetical protein
MRRTPWIALAVFSVIMLFGTKKKLFLALNCLDHLTHKDAIRILGEDVTSTGTFSALYNFDPLEAVEKLFQVGMGYSLPLRDI